MLGIGLWVVTAALLAIALSRYGVTDSTLWRSSAAVSLALWAALVVALNQGPESRALNSSPEPFDRIFLRSAASSRRGARWPATFPHADQRSRADDPAFGTSAPARQHGSLGDGDLLPGIEHRDFPVLVRRAVRQRLGKLGSKVGQVRIAAATADSVTQGDQLTVGQPDCLGLRIPRGAVGPDDREVAHQQAPAGQRQWALDQCVGAGAVSQIRVRNDRTAPVRSGVDLAAAIVGAGSNKRED